MQVRDGVSSMPFWITELCFMLDYAQPTTVPIPGDNVKAGSFFRSYMQRLRMVSFQVIYYPPFLFFTADV